MQKPFDLTKFRTGITKGITGISAGFHDPQDWISTGNYTLNYLISGDFQKGVPLGKVSVFAGESGSGKSFICSGNLVRNAQLQGCQVVLFDSENALDEDWLQALDVDTTPEKLLKISVSMIDDVAKTISDFVKDYKTNYGDLPYEEQPKMLFVVDSLGMLSTTKEMEDTAAGKETRDMTRSQIVKSTFRVLTLKLGKAKVPMVVTNHTYDSMGSMFPTKEMGGGSGLKYAASSIVFLSKKKEKENRKT